jgi:hypothetical protein
VIKEILNNLNRIMKTKVNKYFRNSKNSDPKYFYNSLEISKTTDSTTTAEFIKIVPVGVFPTHPDGPHEITPDHIKEMAVNIQAGGTDILFDFGHESLWNASAEAAGWSPKDLVQAKPDGLYIKYPEFTTEGAEKVNGRAYRYFSPVYCLESFNKQGQEIGAVFHSVGLTNTPYMDTEIDAIGNSQQKIKNRGIKMNEHFLKLLGLAGTATETEIQNAVTAFKTKCGVDENATLEDCIAAIEAKKTTQEITNSAATASLAEKLTEMTKFILEFESDKTTRRNIAAEALVNSAIAEGKLLPKFKDQFVNDAIKNFAAVKEDLEKREKNSAVPGTVHVDKSGKVDLNNPETIANSAKVYKNEQAKSGIKISDVEAVNHVIKTAGGKTD